MITTDQAAHLHEISTLGEKRVSIIGELHECTDTLNEAIKRAFSAGCGGGEIARAARVSRAWVYKVRDGR